jgi:hypothetical protein
MIYSTIWEAMVASSQDMSWDNWKCISCCNYLGDCRCGKGVFIPFVQANMSGCRFYLKGHKCIHCGKMAP